MKQLLKRIRENNILLEIVNGELKGYSNDRAIDPQLIQEIKNNKQELMKFLLEHELDKTSQQPESIPLAPAAESYVLSSSQRRLWLLSQLEGGNTAYNIPGLYVFNSYMDVAALTAAFVSVIARHEVLRTVFQQDENGEVRQLVLSPEAIGFNLGYRDLRMEDEQQVKLMEAIGRDFETTFDLAKGPLLRACMYRLADERYVLSYVMHHIISDARSMIVLLREVEQCYHAAVNFMQPDLAPLRLQYKDYAAWQQSQLNAPQLQEDKAYWLNNFMGELPVVNLLPDKPRPAWKSFRGDAVTKTFSPELANRLHTVLQERKCTLFMGLVAMVNALLYKYTAQTDIIIGSPIDGRDRVELENQIGFYLNTLALRTRFNGSDNFNALLQKVKEVTVGAYEHQAYPFDELIDQLQLERDMSRNALFDVSVVLLNKEAGGNAATPPQQELPEQGLQSKVSKFDLSFDFAEQAGEISLSLTYDTSIYERATVTQLAEHLLWLTEQMVARPNSTLDQLSCLSEYDRYQQLVLFNRRPAPYPKDVTLIQLFEQRAAQTPDAIALVFQGRQFSYRQLNETANQLAEHLRLQHTVGREDLVAIVLDRSEWMIISILAVQKAGAAYVPVDPAYPQERIDYMIADSRCRALIDEQEIAAFCAQQSTYSNENVPLVNEPQDLAYVIYTSGSTGRPKGVMLQHQGVVNRLEWMWKQFHYTAEDVILQKTTFTFDVSVWEIFMPLCWGARMVLCHKDDIASPDRIRTLIKTEKVTCLHFVPGMLGSFMDALFEEASIAEDLRSLRAVITSGEALPLETVKNWYRKLAVPIHNLYGPTEASVDVTHYTTTAADTRIPIGKPIWNTQLYIVDELLDLVPLGAMGEICIAGDGLARGYLNKPELTSEKFIDNPFQPGTKIYRTGDYGRWLPDGNIEYLGRKDFQVKIRGHRIELAEIEAALLAFHDVSAAVVTAPAMAGGERELIAYLVGKSAIDKELLRAYLQASLPAYMVPAYFVQLSSLPLTASGKVNRKQLPEPEGLDVSGSNRYVAPQTATEEELTAIWSEVLRLEPANISATANFFSLGGHSLKATKLVTRILRRFQVKLELRELFTHATIQQQSKLVDTAMRSQFTAIEKVAPAASYPLSASQRRLWVLSQFEAANIAYNIQGANIFRGELDVDALQTAFHSLVERHESLRTVIRPDEEGGARQYILQTHELDFTIRQHDLRAGLQHGETVKQWVEKEFSTPFDLAKGPLLRASLYQVANDEWIFAYVIHHIISDGQSMEIMIRELLAIYNAYRNGEANPLPELNIQYKDYAVWQLQQLSGSRLEAHKAYWLKQFEGELPVIELQSDKLRPARKTYNGSSVITDMDARLSQSIQALAKNNQSTLFMAMLAAVNALLHRYTGQDDIIIGTPVAGREHADLENQVGFYANTLALRTSFSGDDNFLQLLSKVKEVTLGAYEHQVYPFDELVNALHLQRDVSHHPLFDMQVIVQNDESEAKGQSLGKMDVTHFAEAENLTSVFDLVFLFIERKEGFRLVAMYNTDVYSEQLVNRLIEHLQLLMNAIVAQPELPIGELEFLSQNEQQQLLHDFNQTSMQFPAVTTLHGMVEAQVARIPDAPAMVFENVALTYRQLDEKANQFAHHLIANYNLQPGTLVGIMMDKSDKLIVAILGILKAGCAYVPIDPEYPRARKEFIIKDAGIGLLIAGASYFFDLDYFGGSIVLDMQLDTLTEPITSPGLAVMPNHLAYVIYTSGSTGTPKGVMIEHASIVNSIYGQIVAFGVQEGMKELLFASASFDASVSEIFVPLAAGGILHVIGENVRKNPALLEEYITGQALDIVTLPPAYLRLVQIEKLKSLRTLITAGEAANYDDAMHFMQYGQFFNAYGPTESSICAAIYRLPKNRLIENRNIPIGPPVGNTQIYIVNDRLKLVPPGAVGEICLAGDNLSRGYLNKPELTQSKFVHCPFQPGKKMYRTGDLGRWLPDGVIEYIGRKDDQVKIRGNRVELGEIQAAIRSLPGIESAAVIAKAGSQGHKELIAYIVGNKELSVQELRAHLSGLLPSFMIPGYFVQLPEMPLNTNGKIDKRALPDPQGISISSYVEYVAPRNRMEERLVATWQKILEKEKIGINDGFFDLGGDSIKILKMLAEFEKEFKLQIPVAEVYKNDTIGQISDYVAQNRSRIGQQNQQEQQKYAAVRQQFEELKERILASGKLQNAQNIEDIYPMSDIEKGMVFESLANQGLGIYHSQMIIARTFTGFDIKRFRSAMLLMAQKHSILRTAFNITDFETEVQIVYRKIEVEIGYRDVSKLAAAEQQQAIIAFAEAERARPFDLGRAPLWRMDVFNTGKNNIVFVFQCHHAIIDGWSDALFLSELNNLYLKLNENPTHKPAALKSSYKDFIVEHEAYKADENIRTYWKQQLADFSRLELFTEEEEEVKLIRQLDDAFVRRLEDKAIELNTTVKVLSIGAFLYMLRTLNYGKEVVAGLVTNTRPNREDSDKLLGCFLNTIPFRYAINAQETVAEYIGKLHSNLVMLKEYERLSILEISRLFGKQSTSGNPFFDVLIDYVDFHAYNTVKNDESPEAATEAEENKPGMSAFARTNTYMDFMIERTGGGYHLNLRKRKKFRSGFSMDRIADLFTNILQHFVEHTAAPLQQAAGLDAVEKDVVLNAFNDHKREYAFTENPLSLFDQRAKLQPTAPALRFGESELTYHQLWQEAEQLGTYLRLQYQLQPGQLVGVMLERSPKMLVAILGILKSGAAYVPIDADYPAARKAHIMKDAGLTLLVTQTDYIFDLDYYEGEVFAIDVQTAYANAETTPATVQPAEDNLAYVIYTSGSTGKPKGCAITWGNLHNYIRWANSYYYKTGDAPSFGLFTSLSFDLTVTSIFCTLTQGGCLHIYNQRQELAEILTHSFSSGGINSIKLTPSHINLLQHLPITATAMQRAIVGGEEVKPQHIAILKKLNPAIEIYNEYGPTETTVGCIVKQLQHGEPVLIGKPIANAQVYILNDEMNPVPIGVAGEICIGGAGVGKGYVNAPGLTAQKFLPNPFTGGGYMYRTGDSGRWLENGEIEFFGRIDEQVKIRGYRIETGEVENAILTQSGIEAAVVVAREAADGEKQLVAYVVAGSLQAAGAPDAIRACLQQQLPAYMIPAHIVLLPQLPLTSNGKVDRKALPDLQTLLSDQNHNYVPPRNELDENILAVWEKILERNHIGITAGFFETGGDSIRILRMLAELKAKLGIEVSITDAYKYNTVQKLADYISQNHEQLGERGRQLKQAEEAVRESFGQLKERLLATMDAEAAANIEDIYPMSDIEKGMVFESMVSEGSGVYHDQMVRPWVVPGFNVERLQRVVDLLMEKHDILRTSFNLLDYETEVQIVHKSLPNPLQYHDLTGLAAAEQETIVRQFVAAELQQPFQFSHAPLFRIAVFQCSKDEIILVFQCHHAIIDGWSDTLLMTELNNLYLQLTEDTSFRPNPLKANYKDAVVQHEVEKRDETVRRFWQQELQDYSRLDLFTAEENVQVTIQPTGVDFIAKLEKAAASLNTTVKTLSLSAYLCMLKVLSNESEIVTGLLTNLRPNCEDSDKILGCFLNTIPLKMGVDGSLSCADFVNQVQEKMVLLKDKERLSLLDITLIHDKQLSFGNPFFDVLFNYVDFHEYAYIKNPAASSPLEAAGSAPDIFGNIRGNTHFDFLVDRTLGAFKVVVLLNRKLKAGLSPDEVAQLYLNILEHIISNPQSAINEAELVGEAEKKKLLHTFNDTAAAYPHHQTIVDLFVQQVAKTPGAIALVAEDKALTYQQLNERSNQLANYLLNNYALQPDQLVGVKLERNEWLPVAMLAVLKAGAAYVPMDPHYPQERIAYMIEDSRCVTVIDEQELAAFLQQQATFSTSNPTVVNSPAQLAYVIYTSGSTGKPKGVMIEHRNVVNFFTGLSAQIPAGQDDCMLAVTSTSFDISVLELLWTLCNGVQVVLHSTASGLSALDRYVASEDLALDFSLFFFSSYNNQAKDKYNLLLESVKYADEQGFRAVWVPERHFHEFGGLYPNPSVVSAALAMITKQIELRSGSVVSPLHDAIRIAEEWSVVDNLSNGRVGLSFASGWNPNDFALSKYEFKERQKVMHEQIKTVRALWKGEAVTRTNALGKEVELQIFPKPIQPEIPVWITSSGNPETFITAGASGANLLTHFLGQDVEGLAEKIKLYRQARKENGYDERTGKVSVMLHTFIGDDINEVEKIVEQPFIEYLKSSVGVSKITLEEAGINEADLSEDVKEKILRNAFRRYYKSSALIGTVSSVGNMLKQLKEIGVDEVACLVDFGVEEKLVLDNLRNLRQLKTVFAGKTSKQHRPITMMQSTPSFMKLALEDRASAKFLGSLESVLVGGEALPLSLVNNIHAHCKAALYNMYGPTETTIWSCMHAIESKAEKVLIGRPMLNTDVYILGEELKLLPAGIAGDLYIGGKGVARGYLNNDALTNERFIAHPFRPGERLYKTGDLARWLPNGTLEFIGRKDNQVKLRGYRIEPGEIENALQAYPGIEAVAVTVRTNQHEEKELIAYLVSNDTVQTSQLREWLGRSLPLFMIPDVFVQLEALPLTANGKIDRKRLPDPASLSLQTGIEYIAPRTAIEQKLALVWQEVLGKEQVGIKDDYFDLGGNSLKAMRVIKRVMDETGFSLPLTALFNQRNIGNLAAYIGNENQATAAEVNEKEITPADEHIITNMSYSQRTYFSEWYAKEAHVVVSSFEYPALDMDAFRATIQQFIARHEILRTSFGEVDGVIMQRIAPMHEIDFSIPDPVVVSQQELERLTQQAYRTRFNMAVAPLLRVNVYRKKKGGYVVLIAMHHILSDGYSANVTQQELPLLYAANAGGQANPLQPLSFQYRHFSNWQMNFVQSAEGLAHRNYWMKRLQGFDPKLRIAAPRVSAGAKQPGVVMNVSKTIDGALYEAFDRFARQHSLSHAGLLLGVLTLTLHQLSGQQDLTVLTQVSGRDSRFYGKLDVIGLLGNFTNMIMVRNAIDQAQSLVDFLRNVQYNFLEDLHHDAYPADKLLEELPGINQPDFLSSTVLFNYHNYSYFKDRSYVTGEKEEETRTRGDVPLQQAFLLAVSEYDKCLELMFGFNKGEWKPAFQKQVRATFFAILDQVMRQPQLTIAALGAPAAKKSSALN